MDQTEISVWAAVISAAAAAITVPISFYAILRQRKFERTQQLLNERLIEQSDREEIESAKANLRATSIGLGSSKHKIRISNVGPATAKNVRLVVPDENTVLIKSDFEAKFPLDVMERHEAVDLIATVSMGTAPKQPIELVWDDGHGENRSKKIEVVVF